MENKKLQEFENYLKRKKNSNNWTWSIKYSAS